MGSTDCLSKFQVTILRSQSSLIIERFSGTCGTCFNGTPTLRSAPTKVGEQFAMQTFEPAMNMDNVRDHDTTINGILSTIMVKVMQSYREAGGTQYVFASK